MRRRPDPVLVAFAVTFVAATVLVVVALTPRCVR